MSDTNYNPWAGVQPRGQGRHISKKRQGQRLAAALMTGTVETDLAKQTERIEQGRLDRGKDIIERIKADPNDREAHADREALQKEMLTGARDWAMNEYGAMDGVEATSVAGELTDKMGSAISIVQGAGSEVAEAKAEFARQMPDGLTPTQEQYVLSKVAEAALSEQNTADAGYAAVGEVNPRAAASFTEAVDGDSMEVQRFKIDTENRMMSNTVRVNADPVEVNIENMSAQEADDAMRNDTLRTTCGGGQIFDIRAGEGPGDECTAEEADAELSRRAGNPKGSGRSGVEQAESYGARKRREMETGTN